jgi:hypothetical protein
MIEFTQFNLKNIAILININQILFQIQLSTHIHNKQHNIISTYILI